MARLDGSNFERMTHRAYQRALHSRRESVAHFEEDDTQGVDVDFLVVVRANSVLF